MQREVSDRPVEINPSLRGAWIDPAGDRDGRAVLFLHGHTDDMNAVGELTLRLARALGARGVASLRINFRGEGDRMRRDLDSTLHTRIEDTEAAYAFMAARAGVDVARVGVAGWCLGATTAIATAARHPRWFRSMAAWGSPIGDQWTAMTSSETAQRALRDGEATEELVGWKTITTKRAFYESFRGVDVSRLLGEYPGAFLSVRGSADECVGDEMAFLECARGTPRESVILGGMDHVFGAFDPSSGHAERAIEVTADWFVRTL